ncbi:MAG: carboxypeptidase-like regulatory domain-containing protein [Pirellulaceae bacterium]
MCIQNFTTAFAFFAVTSVAMANEPQIPGVCTDNDGKPVSSATATLYYSADAMSEIELVETVATDQEGAFQFKPLAVESDQYGNTRYLVTVTAKDHASFSMRISREHLEGKRVKATLHNQPATLIGYVTGPNGKPVAGATAQLPSGFNREPIAGVLNALTDDKGVFRISDMKPWRPDNPGQQRMSLLIDHPDFARTSTMFESVPQVLRVQLESPAIVTGRVVDAVTNQPVAGTIVSAQGVADSGWYQSRTDADGIYELRMTPDRYNIWAEMDDRIAVAVDSIKAVSGKTVAGADIKLVRGAIVHGNVIGIGGEDEPPAGDLRVAHYGPARPRSGAAVTSTNVQDDGSFRIRVAPGKNYLYLMGGAASINVEVIDGEELKAHLVPGKRLNIASDPSVKMRAIAKHEKQLRESIEDAMPSRDRGDTKAARLLDQLEVFNQREFLFKEPWLQTLHDLVECGPDAVPELIAELDATEDNMMFRCLGFTMRAIGDRRVVPALIRSIPRVYRTHGSDMGLRSDNGKLAAFAQKFDLETPDKGNEYDLGRPIREVFGAIHELTAHDFDDSQVYGIRPTGTSAQQELKRELMERHAMKWATWWEANAVNLDVSKQWRVVDLPRAKPAEIVPVQLGIDYETTATSGNAMLEPVQAGKTYTSFVDLDTGRKCNLPQRWQAMEKQDLPLDEIATWARNEGFDLMGTEYKLDDGKSCRAIRLLGARAIQLPADHWKKRFERIRLEDLAERGQPIHGDYLFRYDDGEVNHLGHAPFFIVTAEESPVLFFLGIEVNDDSLKPGRPIQGDSELDPVAFRKGRRYGMSLFKPMETPKEKIPPGAGGIF